MKKAYLILLMLTIGCSERHTPASVERKVQAYKDSNHQSKIIPTKKSPSISRPIGHEDDAYQDDNLTNDESYEEDFDLSSMNNKHLKSYYKTKYPLDNPNFIWPVTGKIIQHFDHNKDQEGISIVVPRNTPVRSASDGKVIFVGNDKTYGNLIILEHKKNIYTAYAHNSSSLVKLDATVKKGQIIAKSGKSGNVSTPQLYFSIRKGSTTINPEKRMV